jgi:uroporphyrinogen-III decarboxylase
MTKRKAESAGQGGVSMAMEHPVAVLLRGAERARRGALGVADTVPVTAQMSQHSAKLSGESTLRFFSDAKTFLRCELAADLFYDLDGATIHYDLYNIEAEALGARLGWKEGEFPTVDPRSPLLRSVDDREHLRPVRPGAAGRMPYVLEINARLQDIGLPPKVRFTGLFTLAANLVGLEELLFSIVTRPERVHRLMHILATEVVAPWITCQRERYGRKETATGSDALASPPLISVEMVREFSLQYIVELEQLVGGIRLAGLWGEGSLREPRELLDIKTAGSPGSIQALDPDVTTLGPGFFRRYAEETGASLVMGLDANLIGSGPPAEIRSRAERFIEEAGKNGRFILFINDIPTSTPSDNVHAVVDLARTYAGDPDAHCYHKVTRGLSHRPRISLAEAQRAIVRILP